MTAPTSTRLFRPTPSWLIYGLLVVEGLLWLSERFSWFPFNHHKGWTVLIAVVAVCVVFGILLLWLAASLLFRWRFQFSIRSLLVLVVVVAVPCSWLTVKIQAAKLQKKSSVEIIECGGDVAFDYQCTSSFETFAGQAAEPLWLRRLFGDDFFANVVFVSFWTDSKRGTQSLDIGLERLKGFTQLQALSLSGVDVTDLQMEHLTELRHLRFLSLWNSRVTDAGLENLKGMNQLESLFVVGTRVDDAGVKKLQRALPKCKIEL